MSNVPLCLPKWIRDINWTGRGRAKHLRIKIIVQYRSYVYMLQVSRRKLEQTNELYNKLVYL